MRFYVIFLFLFASERVLPARHASIRVWREEFALDAKYFVQNNLIRHAFAFLVGAMFWYFGWNLRERAPVPGLVALLVGWLLSDFKVYWGHRWLHRPGMPWRVHLSHHSMRLFDSLAAFRFHAFEQIMYSVFFVCAVLVFIVGFRWPAAPFVMGYFLGSIWEIFIHSNVDLNLENRIVRAFHFVFISPQAHRLHHMDAFINKNYGNTFTIWDRAFGTYVSPRGVPLAEIGSAHEPGYRESFRRQLLHPFRVFAQRE